MIYGANERVRTTQNAGDDAIDVGISFYSKFAPADEK